MKTKNRLVVFSFISLTIFSVPSWAFAHQPALSAVSAGNAHGEQAPTRLRRRWSISALVQGIFVGGGGSPLPGVALSYQLNNWVALEGQVSSFGILSTALAGVRTYFMNTPIAPYAFARVGAIAAVGESPHYFASDEGTRLYLAFSGVAGLGAELVLQGGFSLALDAGPAFVVAGDGSAGVAANANLLVGYRW